MAILALQELVWCVRPFPLPAEATILPNCADHTGALEVLMFDSLAQQMKKDEDRVSTSGGRMMRYGLYALAWVLVFGGLIYAVHLLA